MLEDDNDGIPVQDYHTILSMILELYLHIQKQGGFFWDLTYQGKVYDDIEFIPYVYLIKCKTEEADKLAGSYLLHQGNVSQLCQYCVCPTEKPDDHS